MTEMTLERLTTIVQYLDEHDIEDLFQRVTELEGMRSLVRTIENKLDRLTQDVKDLTIHQDRTDQRISRYAEEVANLDIDLHRLTSDVRDLERRAS